MIPPPPHPLGFLLIWSVAGGLIGCLHVFSPIGDTARWSTCNWAQRMVMAACFGPLFCVVAPTLWLIGRYAIPAVAAVWRWLGTL